LIRTFKFAEAGKALLPIEKRVLRNASRENIPFEKFKAFQNGIFFHMNVTSPFEAPKCYDRETGEIAIDLFSTWAAVVADSDEKNVVEVTKEYFRGDGRDLWKRLKHVYRCFDKTHDQKRINKAYGVDIHGDVFWKALKRYIVKNPKEYLDAFIKIDAMFRLEAPIVSGMLIGEFYRTVARTIPPKFLE